MPPIPLHSAGLVPSPRPQPQTQAHEGEPLQEFPVLSVHSQSSEELSLLMGIGKGRSYLPENLTGWVWGVALGIGIFKGFHYAAKARPAALEVPAEGSNVSKRV